MPILGIIASSISGNLTGSRGILMGGQTAANYTNTIQYNDLSTTGNYSTFGTLAQTAYLGGSASSSTRAVYYMGFAGVYPASTGIQYITIATTGNATSFGSVTQTAAYACSSSHNGTRGIFAGGYDNAVGYYAGSNYITIATTGNSTTFGTIFQAQTMWGGGSSTTRGLNWGASALNNTIYYVTIATTGNWTSFGTLSQTLGEADGAFSSTRIVIMGGQYSASPPYATTNMEYVTTASTGNGTNFGTLATLKGFAGCNNNGVTGNMNGGLTSPWATRTTEIIRITIATLGNGTSIAGVMTVAVNDVSGASNCHGAL